MKEGFRKTIRNLQDRNKELEQKVRELEQQLAT
jgi:cell division septum initiation protein DivIVA